jgi:hypothetical protein
MKKIAEIMTIETDKEKWIDEKKLKLWFFIITSKNVCVLQWDLESITGLLVARKSIETLDTRGFECYVSQLILRFYFSHTTWTRTGLGKKNHENDSYFNIIKIDGISVHCYGF